MYQLHLPNLKECPYVEDVLWVPELKSPGNRTRCSGHIPCVVWCTLLLWLGHNCCRHAGVQKWSPRAGATWEGYQCWLGLPAGYMVGWKPLQKFQPEWTGLARLVLRASPEHTVLCRLMEKHRNVALQCWANWVEGELCVCVCVCVCVCFKDILQLFYP